MGQRQDTGTPTDYVDLSHTVCAVRSVAHRGWLAADIREAQWLLPITAAVESELTALAEFIDANPLPLLQRSLTDIRLPHCQALMCRLRDVLDNGVGFAVLDRLPVEQYGFDTIKAMYWLLGQMVGRPVAQKWNGQMVYDVQDKGIPWGYGIRGSHTNVELVFHTDNAFARCVPDYVGLLCRQPAKHGGISRFCSLYTVHERIGERSPAALQRLYQPMFFDRQKEHAEHAPAVTWAPWFSWQHDRLFTRANTSLVRKGYALTGEPMDSALTDALALLDEVCAASDIWFESPLQRGQIQYLNNHEIGHYRSEYTDFDEPERKRHLVRLWHREHGSSAYDGDLFTAGMS